VDVKNRGKANCLNFPPSLPDNNPDQDPQIGADDEGRRKSTPLIDYPMTYTKCKKRSLGAEDLFQ
jgi:hypothetical protein